MILSLSLPEIIEIKRKILRDRKYKVPTFFYSYIDDDFIIDTIVYDEQSEERDAFIKEYQKNVGFHSYKNLVVTLLEHNLLGDLHLFDPALVTKYCKRLLHIFTEKNVIHIMRGWYTHEKTIPFSIVYLYVTKVCGRLWFMSPDKNTMILRDKLYDLKCHDAWSDMLVEILYQLYSNVAYLNKTACSEPELCGYGLEEYYKMPGSKYIYINKPTLKNNDIVSTMCYLKNAYKVDVLPDDLSVRNDKLLIAYPEYIPEYRKVVRDSLSRNANNIHMITWTNNLKSTEFQEITDKILESEVPLNNFATYMYIYNVAFDYTTVPMPLTKEFLLKFIQSGTDVNTMLYYLDVRECGFEIIKYSSEDALRQLIRNQSQCRGSMIGRPVGAYILTEVNWMSVPVLMRKMLPLVCEDSLIFDSLPVDMKDFITRSIKLDWLLTNYPQLLLSDYFKTFINNSTIDMKKLCSTVPDTLSYLPAKSINLSTVHLVAKTRGYVKLTFVRLTGENVLSMVNDDCGYGYILDLPTTVQMNFIVISILNRIFRD